ncbi:alpha-1,3-mannosyl-glycoprotein 2-beta-N-acetylglucosaminyltransferase isoform X2 [Iris pallida]|uniref:Alpha-1,3-mannosyl-glycoprotein 2-beta-N-acetylglucosaminyltransferase n=1 Tax=Iris pallida TaxID=29817 RepID=A0AAX6HHR5_IRIPA|nr:alpha-1,3-mannosyl-glycoprotein 2-beta-N-acetylglucosaminyltransferase isoform X2 [Iris pallida]
MEIAPDFFDYFEATARLFDKDKTIMAVSSWNDNGQVQFVHDPKALYRSDFFPGLGWMLTKSIWDELSPNWPKAYPYLLYYHPLKRIRKDRQFIRPEICRTYNFGEHGSSMGQFYHNYLEPIKLNDVQVDWKSMDLSYLTEDKFLSHFAKLVSDARPVHGPDVLTHLIRMGTFGLSIAISMILKELHGNLEYLKNGRQAFFPSIPFHL